MIDEPLDFDVPAGDVEALRTWLNAHRAQFRRSRWFRRADDAVAAGNDRNAWVIVRAEAKRRSRAPELTSLDPRGNDDLMKPFHWWAGVLLVIGALLFHAAFPRYHINVVGEGGVAVIRLDRWSGNVEVGIVSDVLPAWLTCPSCK